MYFSFIYIYVCVYTYIYMYIHIYVYKYIYVRAGGNLLDAAVGLGHHRVFRNTLESQLPYKIVNLLFTFNN